MKRQGYLYEQIYNIENLKLAHKKAKLGKSKQHGVRVFNLNEEDNIINLHHVLLNKEYKTSKYEVFTLFEGKERQIFKLPYRDRVVQWAIVLIIGGILTRSFIKDTYSCIKKRGIHKAIKVLTKSLKDKENTKYCLKIDVKKYFPSINGAILKKLIRKKFKDKDLLNLLDEIIDSHDKGLPIGNMTSQIFGNFYLSYFDHYIKKELKVKYYQRYCDDAIILSNSKEELRIILNKIRIYLKVNLELELSKYQIFPVWSRGINFLGYINYHTHIGLRPSIKKKYIRMIKLNNNIKSKASYHG